MSDLPPGWEWASLSEVCESIVDGDHQPPPQTSSGIPFLVIGNIRNYELNFNNCRYVSESYLQSLKPVRRPQKGDVLYSLVGSYGIPVVVANDRPFCVQRHIGILRPNSKISSSFLSYALRSREVFNQATQCATGTAQLTVPLSGLRGIRIPLPSRMEQDRIVAAIEEHFSRLDAGTLALSRAGRNLKRARTAVLDAAVAGKLAGIRSGECEEIALGDLLDDIHAGKSFKCVERPADLQEWGVVKVSAMTWGRFLEDENKTVTDPLRVDPRFEIHPGDLLVSRANTVDYVGAAVLVGKCRPRLLLSDKSLRLVPKSRVLPEWLLINLRTSAARKYIESMATGTSDSMRNISQPKLKRLKIKTPSIEIQSAIIAEVDRVMSQMEQLDGSIGDSNRSAQALRTSILTAAFSGRLA